MSKGNRVIPLRFPPELLAEVEDVIERSHATRAGEPWTRTAFILTAVRDKLAHMRRSNNSSQRRRRAKLRRSPPPGYDGSEEMTSKNGAK